MELVGAGLGEILMLVEISLKLQLPEEFSEFTDQEIQQILGDNIVILLRKWHMDRAIMAGCSAENDSPRLTAIERESVAEHLRWVQIIDKGTWAWKKYV